MTTIYVLTIERNDHLYRTLHHSLQAAWDALAQFVRDDWPDANPNERDPELIEQYFGSHDYSDWGWCEIVGYNVGVEVPAFPETRGDLEHRMYRTP